MLLAIDTSTRQIGLALYDGDKVLSEMAWTSPFHHTVELAPAVALTFERARIDAGNLQAVGIATGPGSFTALRTGLAFAKGLAMTRSLPLVGIPSLDLAAESMPRTGLLTCAVLEAGRKRLAVGWYLETGGALKTDMPPELLTAAALADRITRPTAVGGELDRDAREALAANANVRLVSPAKGMRRAGVLAEMAWSRWQSGDQADAETLSPVYLTDEGLAR